MELTLVERKTDKIKAQQSLVKHLSSAWGGRENRRVVWRPDSRELDIIHNGQYWFVASPPNDDQNTPRYWNSFGAYHANRNLQIAVEINIPTTANERTVSGFFAEDQQTGIIYLMHDGAVGGGRKGVGKAAFLAWSGEQLVPVKNSEGLVRLGILVTPIKPLGIANHVASFTQKVLDFKQAVKSGEFSDDPISAKNHASYDDYFQEFSGKKRGQRAKEFEYISRHGDIVHALCEWRKSQKHTSERIVKNAYIDLGVSVSEKLTELYEVKTNADRQTLYTAIGQILVHAAEGANNTKLHLVLPYGEEIPQDVGQTLKQLKIRTLRFALTDQAVEIFG